MKDFTFSHTRRSGICAIRSYDLRLDFLHLFARAIKTRLSRVYDYDICIISSM